MAPRARPARRGAPAENRRTRRDARGGPPAFGGPPTPSPPASARRAAAASPDGSLRRDAEDVRRHVDAVAGGGRVSPAEGPPAQVALRVRVDDAERLLDPRAPDLAA